jgi:hypothetical protein
MRRLLGLRSCAVMFLVALTGVVADGQAASAAGEGAQLAERLRSGAWDRFSVRMVVRREWVRGEGGPAGYRPVSDEYLYKREKTAGGWTTRVEVVNSSAATVRTRQGDSVLANALGIAAMEDDEDGTAPRFFNRAGVEIVPPSLARRQQLTAGTPLGLAVGVPGGLAAGVPSGIDAELLESADAWRGIRKRATGREWVKAFVMAAGEGRVRLEQTTREFGRRSGWVRGYGRYLKATGDRSVELLMDEDNGVPIETNVVEGGALRSHTTFAYERATTGALLRRGVRIERAASTAEASSGPAAVRGGRRVTDIRYHDVQVTAKGAR